MRSVCALIAAATAVILGASVGVGAAGSSNGAGVVTAVSGPVTVNRQDALPQLLRFRDRLYWRDVVGGTAWGVQGGADQRQTRSAPAPVHSRHAPANAPRIEDTVTSHGTGTRGVPA